MSEPGHTEKHLTHLDGFETTVELQKRFEHIRRVTRKESTPHMRPQHGDERFGNDYSGFLDFYSRDQLHSLEKCFLMADHDRDGVLNDVELKYWMEKHNRPISNKDLKHILKIADSDGDGALSFKEFLFLCKKMELKDTGHGPTGTIYDCFGADNTSVQEIKHFVKQPGSYTHLGTEIHTNLQYFEDRIAYELLEPKPNEHKEIIVDYSDSEFNLQEFCKDIKHPVEEYKEICEEKFGNSEGQKRFRTELHIVPENNKGRSMNTRFSIGEDDTQIILPVNPGSTDKFDNDQVGSEGKPLDPQSFRASLNLNVGGEEVVSVDESFRADKEIQVSKEINEAVKKGKAKQSIRLSESDNRPKVIAPDLQEDFETLELNLV